MVIPRGHASMNPVAYPHDKCKESRGQNIFITSLTNPFFNLLQSGRDLRLYTLETAHRSLDNLFWGSTIKISSGS